MSLVILDLNDYELRLFRDGELITTTTGYALVDDTGVRLGDDALRRFRLHPRKANNQYWQRMNMEPLAAPGPGAAHHADLIYLHLARMIDDAGVTEDDDIIIATPGTTSADQLGLLLGITNELKLNVVGLVDTAVAMAAAAPLAGDAIHLDVALHRATLTNLDAADDISRNSCEDLMELGLTHLLDSWVSVVADRFVAQTRFDPLSIAETEQQVYDRMWQWLEDPDHSADLDIAVEYKGNERRVDTALNLLIDKALQRYKALSRRPVTGRQILLSHRAAKLPGLAGFLEAAGAHIVEAKPLQLIEGITPHAALLRSEPDALRFVSTLPRLLPAASDVPRPPTAQSSEAPDIGDAVARPTHLLLGATAVAVGSGIDVDRRLLAEVGETPDADFADHRIRLEKRSDGIVLRTERPDLVRVNGAPVATGHLLGSGDRLDVAGHTFSLITVVTG